MKGAVVLIDKEQWKKTANPKTIDALIGYRRANLDFIVTLEDILKKSTTLAELRNNITKLCVDRKSFVEFTGQEIPKIASK